MTGAARLSRVWAIGGLLVAVGVFAAGWFLLIAPQYDEADRLGASTQLANTKLVALRHRLVELRQQNKELDTYEAQLVRDRAALPTTSGMADFLRELQAGGADAGGVVANAVTVGAPTQVTAGGAKLYALPVTVVASGGVAALDAFLDQLQREQPRAVFITNVDEVPSGENPTLTGEVSLTLSLQVFVAPVAGGPPPSDGG